MDEVDSVDAIAINGIALDVTSEVMSQIDLLELLSVDRHKEWPP